MLQKHITTMLTLFFILLSLYVYGSESESTINVNTTLGVVKGLRIQTGNGTVYQFRKLPYAQPPVGDLRFKKPKPVMPWNGTLDATKYGPLCMQKVSESWKSFLENSNVSEDCLFLNIYVPGDIDTTPSKAVMVYIHGGGYRYKGGTFIDATKLGLQGDVIVVTLNYRLHIFGFYSTEDAAARGNYGLWDQVEALKWIQDNIGVFGGDRNKVTVFGHSAGGYSIGLLTISPVTANLFQRAIPMSGFGLSDRAITKGAREMSFRIAKKLNCYNDSNTTLQTFCISNKTSQEIQNVFNEIYAEDGEAPQFIMRPAPVIDGELLKDTPANLLADPDSDEYKRFMEIDYMAGTNLADGGLIRSKVSMLQKTFNFSVHDGVPTRVLCESVAIALARDYYNRDKSVSDAICKAYTYSGNQTRQGENLVALYGDMMYGNPAVQTLRIHTKSTQTTFQFLFSHKASFVITKNLPIWVVGAYHGDEVVFVFQPTRYNFTTAERNLSDQIMTYLSNFAKFGNPNGDGTNEDPSLLHWPEFQLQTQPYMDMTLNPSVRSFLDKSRLEFWNSLAPTSAPSTSGATFPVVDHNQLHYFIVFYILLNIVLSE